MFSLGFTEASFREVKQRVKRERQFRGLSVQDEAKLGSPLSCMSSCFFLPGFACVSGFK